MIPSPVSKTGLGFSALASWLKLKSEPCNRNGISAWVEIPNNKLAAATKEKRFQWNEGDIFKNPILSL